MHRLTHSGTGVACLSRVQHVPLLSETLRMLAANDLSAAAYPYAAGSQVRHVVDACWCWLVVPALALKLRPVRAHRWD